MTASEYWFRGIVSESEDLRPADGPFIVTVEVTEPLGPAQFAAGTSFQVLLGYGYTPHRCVGEQTEGPPAGAEVIVYAHDDQVSPGYLAICQDDRYYMRVEAHENELQPPPLPTCPPDIHCGLNLRTVTVELWSCEGGPCTGSEESGCQRGVSLEIGDDLDQIYYDPQPEPFFCAVQFHRVPDFTYLVRVVGGRVACGPACDGYEACAALASENHIAIVPVAEGECPVHVIS